MWCFVQWIREGDGSTEVIIDVDAGGAQVVRRDADGNQILNPNYKPPQARLAIYGMRAFEGDIAKTLSTTEVAATIADDCRLRGATRVFGDQYMQWAWESEFSRLGLHFQSLPWTNNKGDAVSRFRQYLREEILILEPGAESDALIREAASFIERRTPGGGTTYSGRGKSHDDRIMTALLAAAVDIEQGLRGSPLKRSNERTEAYA